MLDRHNRVLQIIGVIVLALLILPLGIVVVTSFGTEATISFPIKGFTLAWYANIWTQPAFVSGFQSSLTIALLASLLALLIGVPAVYALTRFNIPKQGWFQTLFLSPTLIPEIVIGFALYQTLVISWRLPLWPSLLIGHLLLCLPYVIRLVTSSMLHLDSHIEEAAWTLGTSRPHAFFTIVLPNIRTSIVAAFMLCFINSFNNIPISLFLNGPSQNMLPTAILNYLQNNYDPTVSALSVLLMLFTAALMILMERLLGVGALTTTGENA